MDYSKITEIFEAIEHKNAENINKFISFLDFAINENLLIEHKDNSRSNPLMHVLVNRQQEFKPVADYFFDRFPEYFDDYIFKKLFEKGYSYSDFSKKTDRFRELINKNRDSHSSQYSSAIGKNNHYLLDYFSLDYIQNQFDKGFYLLSGITEEKIHILDQLQEKGIKFKPEHFIGNKISNEKISKYINIDEKINNSLPALFSQYPLSLKEYNHKVEKKDDIFFNFLNNYYYNLGNTYIHQMRDLFAEFKNNHEEISKYKADNFTAAEIILYREFSMIKKMVDMNKFKIETNEEAIKLKKYLESNKYLKNIDDLIEKLKFFSILKQEDNSVNEIVMKALNLISPYNENFKYIDMHINYQKKIPIGKYFYSDIPSDILESIGKGFSQLNSLQKEYFFSNRKVDSESSNLFINMLPQYQRYNRGYIIRNNFYDILNNETKGEIVSLFLIKKQPEFFYGFKNDTFREKHKNDVDYQIYFEKEELQRTTLDINKVKRDLTL